MLGGSRSVVIMGAGPAGLATGFALSLAGWSVQVYEQAPMVGGLARTEQLDGFRFDIGGHRWFTKKDELNEFLVNLLGDELILVNRISRIYFDGKYVDYPLKTSNILKKIGPITGARAVSDFVVSMASSRLSSRPVVSMEDAYVAQFGRTLYELFFRNYSEKVWGKACTELSGDWVTQRTKGLSLGTAIRDALKRSDGKVESLVERFMYPRDGYGRISERMAEQIESNGGSVNLGWRVVRARHDQQRLVEIVVSNGREERTIGADHFVSSIPMTELAQIMTPTAPAVVLEATQRLTFRAVITVNLLLNRPSVTNDTWVYVHDSRVIFARLHEPRNWSPAMAPDGKTSLVMEIFCEENDEVWRRSDDDLVAQVVRDLDQYLDFIQPRDVIAGQVIRSRDAYPRYGLDYKPAVETVKNYLRSYENLAIVGRGGTFRYNNADHALETGLLAARQLLGEAVDPDSVNTEQEYLEERRMPTPSR